MTTKKSMKKLLALLLALSMLVMMLVSCTGDVSEPGAQGQQGQQGERGEKGDKGDKGDKGETGAQGPAGEKGQKGDKGEVGDVGPAGANGANGADGQVPYIGANGNWWVGDTDLGVSAEGKKGDLGPTGDRGPQGLPGADGKDGDKGEPGKTVFAVTDDISFRAAIKVPNSEIVLFGNGEDFDLYDAVWENFVLSDPSVTLNLNGHRVGLSGDDEITCPVVSHGQVGARDGVSIHLPRMQVFFSGAVTLTNHGRIDVSLEHLQYTAVENGDATETTKITKTLKFKMDGVDDDSFIGTTKYADIGDGGEITRICPTAVITLDTNAVDVYRGETALTEMSYDELITTFPKEVWIFPGFI